MAEGDTAPAWNGVPEVIAKGSPYDIGFAHGSQIPNRIRTAIKNYAALFLETAEADWQTSKLRASTYLPSLEVNEPDLVEEMRAIAKGANLDFLDILALNLRSEITLTNYSDGCTSIATVTPSSSGSPDDFKVFFAQNWDWVGEARDATAFFDIHKTGAPRMRMFGEAGIVAKHGVNEAGVALGMNAIRCKTVDKTQLPIHLAMRRALECRSVDEALAVLSKKGFASCANFVMADRSGKVVSIECTPKGLAPIYPEPGERTVWHTNHLWSPNVPVGIEDRPAMNSFFRLERMKELSRGKEADAAMIRGWLSDMKGSPGSICRSAPENAVGVERGETLATIIVDATKASFELSLGKPCSNPPVRTVSIA